MKTTWLCALFAYINLNKGEQSLDQLENLVHISQNLEFPPVPTETLPNRARVTL